MLKASTLSLSMLFLLLLPASASMLASAQQSSSPRIVLRLEPRGDGSWHASVEFRLPGLGRLCSGVVAAVSYYAETRSVSQRLLALPLYYVLDSVCPGLPADAAVLLEDASYNVTLTIIVPGGCTVRSGLDWRGFGPLGGPYRVPARLFARYYIYAGLVVACSGYRAVDLPAYNLSLVEPSDTNYSGVAAAVACVAGKLRGMLGPSPLEPAVLVVASPRDHSLVLPGVGLNLGGVVYVKPSPLWDSSDAIAVAAHETVHCWVGRGPIRGDEVLVEGAAQLLALLALQQCGLHAGPPAEGRYASLLLIHQALYSAGLRACREDIYTAALRALGPGEHSFVQLVSAMYSEAEKLGCAARFAELIGEELVAKARGSSRGPPSTGSPAGSVANVTSTPKAKGAAVDASSTDSRTPSATAASLDASSTSETSAPHGYGSPLTGAYILLAAGVAAASTLLLLLPRRVKHI
jgi:hypothetical protein